jgi:hypothetical protein
MIFKTLRLKATAVFIRLRIYLCALKYTNKLSSAVAGETVTKLDTNLSYPCIILFYLFTFSLFSFFSIMNSTPIYQFAKPMSASSKPPESSEPIQTPSYELCPCFINMIRENPSREKVMQTHTHTYKSLNRSFHACVSLACQTIT